MLNGQPWLFDAILFSLKAFAGFTTLAKMVFDTKRFWIQMNQLPLACLNIEMGDQIGRTVGKVIDCVLHDFVGSGGQILRVYIEVNLYKSIPRGRIINVKGKR